MKDVICNHFLKHPEESSEDSRVDYGFAGLPGAAELSVFALTSENS